MARTDKSRRQEEAKILIDAYADLNKVYSSNLDLEKQVAELQERRADRQRLINELQDRYNSLSQSQKDTLIELIKLQTEEESILKSKTKELKTQNEQLQKQRKIQEGINNTLKKGWEYLMQSDKVIRQTILNLGMSGVKAELVRTSFEQSALYAAKLGGGLEDVQTVMTGFADETGRAVALSSDMVKSVLAIGRGTGLGVEQATKLAAQFEFMGIDAKSTMDYVQGVVDTSERMGVNTTKVLKNVNDNFKKLSTFTFQGGVKAFGQMAMDAEKTRVSMASALNVAEATRGLEQVIELGANLQVMGGRFAEMDPFQWLYMARNEPDKMTEKLSEMTKGIYTLRQNSDGTFEKFITPADRDRLANVAKSLGIAQEEMFEIAQRRLDLETMNKQLAGTGLTGREKELIQGAAKFNSDKGRFEVMLAGTMRDISTLTKEQANSFAKEQSTLEKRAIEAQNFDEAFKATINELKSVLLPILRVVKVVLDTVRPWVEGLTGMIDKFAKTKLGDALLKGGFLIISGGFLLIKAYGLLSNVFTGLKSLPAILKGLFPKFGGGIGAAAPAAGGAGGGFAAGAGGALKGLGTGAGVGLAAVGMGKGIDIAAGGITKLAEAMSKLSTEQAKALKSIAMTLAIAFPAAAVGVGILAAVAAPAALPLLALGAAMAGIGFGIFLATKGIGQMAIGLAELNRSGGGAGKQLLGVAAGVGAISLAMFAGGGVASLFAFNNSLARMAKNAGGIEKIGTAFQTMKVAIAGSKDDFIQVADAIASIGKVNIKGGGAITELANTLKKPLKVEFADKRLTVLNDITLNIDGERFTHKVIRVPAFIERSDRMRQGLEG